VHSSAPILFNHAHLSAPDGAPERTDPPPLLNEEERSFEKEQEKCVGRLVDIRGNRPTNAHSGSIESETVQNFRSEIIEILRGKGLPTAPKAEWFEGLLNKLRAAKAHPGHFLERIQARRKNVDSWGFLLVLVQDVAGGDSEYRKPTVSETETMSNDRDRWLLSEFERGRK